MGLKVSFDLSSILAKEFTREQRTALTPNINRVALKQEFGQRAIERILERTNQGKDVNGVDFTAYSTAYKNSTNFQIFGKTRRVNLKLSGQMHAAIDVIPSVGPKVTIAFPDGLQSKKARRHNFGLSKMPRRFFFDLTDKEQGDILKGIFRDSNTLDRIEEIQETLSALESNISSSTIIGEDTVVQQTNIPASILSVFADISEDDDG